MQISPLTAPAAVTPTPSDSPSVQTAKQRAIAILTGQANAQTTPVQDPSKVTPEEARAAQRPSQGQPEASTGQSDTSDGQVAEAAAPEVTKSEEAPAPLSSQYAQLARKEKALRAQVNAVKAQEAAMKAREDAVKAKEAEMLNQYVPKDRFAKEPLKVLQEQGYTAEQITNMLLNAPDPAQEQQQAVIEELRAEIRALRDDTESTKKTYQQSQTQAYTQAVNQIRNDTKQLVASDANFETIQATDSVEDVVELITKTFEKDGIVMSVEDAAAAVEEYLVEEALKVARLSKIQKRLQPAAAPAAKTPPKPQATQTLTSAMNNTRPLTAKERALLAFKGELKS